MVKTQEQRDRETDRRLRKSYGISLEEYNQMFRDQGGGCAVCGDGPGTRRLNVDHDHRWKKTPLAWGKYQSTWSVTAHYRGRDFLSQAFTKRIAKKEITEQLKTASVRGLLCHRCNRGMILFRDRPDLLIKATDYLNKFQG